MEEKKELKIKFKTAVIAIIVVAIILVAIIAVAINNSRQEKLRGNTTIISEVDPNEQILESDFSLRFLKLENKKQNMVYSPLSIKYALNMLNEGAGGNTKTQIENVLGDLNLTKYNTIDEVLSLANSVYIRDTFAEYVKEDYRKTITEKYNAEVNYDSFSNATNINKWIEDKTLGIIQSMLNDETVQNPDNNMILINALAIDMGWENPFDTNNTYGEDFYLENGDTMTATMMHKETMGDDASYYKDNDITALTMDLQEYDNTQFEFVAIMPEENLADYIETLTIEDVNTILENTTLASDTQYGVDISIPKFSFDYNLQLKQDLMDLGITDAFDENLADFSNMASEKLCVGDALHKADIDFSEEGIKAAAVTVIIMDTNSIMPIENEPEEIRIDKPFMYLIRDKQTNEIWFVGTVYEPNSWKQDMEEYR